MADATQERTSTDEELVLNLSVDELAGAMELEAIVISPLPEGVTFSAGEEQEEGGWRFEPRDFDSAITLFAPTGTQAMFELPIKMFGRSDGEMRSVAVKYEVDVNEQRIEPEISPSATQTNITLRVSGQHFEGAPKFRVIVDGEQVGDVYTVSANYGQGEWEEITIFGDFGATGPGSIEIDYINDHWGGHWTKDRNLLVDHIEVNGTTLDPESASYVRPWGDPIQGQGHMIWGGKLVFDTADLPSPAVMGEEDSPIKLGLNLDLPSEEEADTQVTVSGLPKGAVLSAGTQNDDGTWTVAAEELTDLAVTAAPNTNPQFSVVVSVVSIDRETGDETNFATQVPVRVEAVADAPVVKAAQASANEDGTVALDISAALTDTDGSETITNFSVAGVPEGATLSAGTQHADGSWTIAPDEIAGLTLTPPTDSDESFELVVSATATESNGVSATSVTVLPVDLQAVADAPMLKGPDELSEVKFRISGRAFEGSPEFSGPPEFFIHIDGEQVGGMHYATADIALGEWEEFSILGDFGPDGPGRIEIEFTNDLWCAPNCADRDLVVDRIEVNATPYEAEDARYLRYGMAGDDTGEQCDPVEGDEKAAVGAIAEGTIAGQENMYWNGRLIFDTRDNGGPQGAVGQEDSAIALNLSAALTDIDGSETIGSIVLSGVPVGAVLSAGTLNEDGSYTLTQAELVGLTVTPPANRDENFELNVAATTVEAANGDSATSTTTFTVNVNAIADQGVIKGQASTGSEREPVNLDIQAALTDLDESEALHVELSNVPKGAVLSAGERGADGVWRITADALEGLQLKVPGGWDDDFVLKATAVSTEAANGDQAKVSVEIPVAIEGVAGSPNLSVADARGYEDSAIALDIAASSTDTDGSEVVAVLISGVPQGASLSAGRDNLDGSWTLSSDDLQGLTVTPPADADNDFELNIAVTVTESSNGDSATKTASMQVHVDGVADAPVFSDSQGNEGSSIVVTVGAQAYQGDPQFRILVDGEQVGGIHTATGDYRNGDRQVVEIHGDFGADGPGKVEVDYINDVWGGHWTLDRNLYVESVEVNGTSYDPGDSHYARDWLSDTDGQSLMAYGGSLVFDTGSNGGPYQRAGNEDSAIALDLDAALADTDGSESISSIVITGVPAGAVLSAGEDNGRGTWTLSHEDLQGLTVTPPADSDVDFKLEVTAITREGDNGDTAESTVVVPVSVHAVADVPAVKAADVHGAEDQFIALEVGGALADIDGSESMHFVIGNVPAGATLNAGVANDDGTWTMTPDELAKAAVRPPANFSGTFNLSVVAVATEANGGDTASSDTAFQVTVEGVADAAKITRKTARGTEDGPIDLSIQVAPTDEDGSESIGDIVISRMPEGAVLSAGTDNGDGTWSLSEDDLVGLQITPPADSADDFTIRIGVQTIDDSGSSTVTTKGLRVKVVGDADAPDVKVGDVAGKEDEPIALTLDASLVDTDGSESLSIEISGVPSGATLSAGQDMGNGTWALEPDKLLGLELRAAPNYSGRLDLTFTAIASESEGDAAHTAAPFSVHVEGVADLPFFQVRPAQGLEDREISLDLRASLGDRDDSETLSFLFSNVPDGAVLSVGEKNEDGTWTVAGDDADRLAITAPLDSNEDFVLAITAISTERDGDTASRTMALPVSLTGVADKALASASDVTTLEDTPVRLNLSAALKDDDMSETLSVVIAGLPFGARLSHGLYNGNGTWSIAPEDVPALTVTPPRDYSGDIEMSMRVVTQENDGDMSVVELPFSIHVQSVVDDPNGFSSSAGKEDGPIGLNLIPGLNDIDGSESVVSAVVSQVPQGAVLSAGTEVSPGVYKLEADELQGLTITPAHNSNVDFALDVKVTIEETDGVRDTFSGPLRVSVKGVADLPDLEAYDIAGETNRPIEFDFKGALTDTDGSEHLYYIIEDIPKGTQVSNGYNNGDGSWTVLPGHLDGLTMTAPRGFSGEIPLVVRAVSRENDGDLNYNTLPFSVTVKTAESGEGGGTHIPNIAGYEDNALAIDLSSLERAGVREAVIKGLPAGVTLSAGTLNEDGSYTLTNREFADVSITPEGDSDKNFEFDVSYVNAGGGRVSEAVNVDVTAVADAPKLAAKAEDGVEDTAFALQISGALVDTDGSESLSYVVRDLPSGATLNVGFLNPVTGVWTVSEEDLARLEVTPPKDFSGDLKFTVGAVSTETTGDFAITTQTVVVPIEAVADAPKVSAKAEYGTEDGPLALNLSVAVTDESEKIASITLFDLPEGASVIGATDNGDGSYSVDPARIADVMVTPPAHQHGTFSYKVSAISEEPNGDAAETTKALTFRVASDPDAPIVGANDVQGSEDSAIALDLSGALVDQDGSEVMTIVLGGIPTGAILSTGMNNGDGTWSLTPNQIDGLTLMPPADFAGNLPLTITGVSLEMDTGETATTRPLSFNVEVTGAADAPNIDAANSTGFEDKEIPVVLNASLSDTDGSETLVALFDNVPAGAVFSAGVNNGDGTWTIQGDDLNGLTVTPPPHSAQAFELSVTLTAVEQGSGDASSVSDSVKVNVIPVVDAAIVTANSVAKAEDQTIALDINASLADSDGSETLTLLITGVPDDASLSAGTANGDGSWTVTAADLNGLVMTPPENFSGNLELSLIATSTEVDGAMHTHTTPFSVSVAGVADAPTLSVSDAAGLQGGHPIALDINTALTDLDGSETLSVTIYGVPLDATLNRGVNQGNGVWLISDPQALNDVVLTPPAHLSGEFTLQVHATSLESNGDTTSSNATLAVVLAPVEEQAETFQPQPVSFDVETVLHGFDDSAQVSLTVSNVPAGGVLSAGVDNGDGTWTVDAPDMSEIVFTPRVDMSGKEVTLDLSATATQSDGSSADAESAVTLNIEAPVASDASYAGTDGADTLSGGDADDVLTGAAGADMLTGGAGEDVAFGGEGDDAFSFGVGDGKDIFVGGDGKDIVQLRGVQAGPNDELASDDAWLLMLHDDSPDYAVSDTGIEFDTEASGTIALSDGSELEFYDVVRVEW